MLCWRSAQRSRALDLRLVRFDGGQPFETEPAGESRSRGARCASFTKHRKTRSKSASHTAPPAVYSMMDVYRCTPLHENVPPVQAAGNVRDPMRYFVASAPLPYVMRAPYSCQVRPIKDLPCS
jgi:hypothetical protein